MFEPTKILITGASGFIGSFLCDEALNSQMSVWAGVRSTSSRKWLQNEWLQFQTLDMANRDVLHAQLATFKEQHGKWDIIIHAAGATKCLNPEDFDTNNYDCTVNLVEELKELNMIPKMFVYMSSLSVLGPIKEEKKIQAGVANAEEDTSNVAAPTIYAPLKATDEPQPNTAYANSKSKSEN
jgi:UDP-glucose 4-epimerase